MAMTGNGMGALITSKIQSIPGITINNVTELQNFCNAIGAGIVEYIQENADVSPSARSGENLSVTPGLTGEVTSGAGAGGNTVTNELGPIEGLGKIL